MRVLYQESRDYSTSYGVAAFLMEYSLYFYNKFKYFKYIIVYSTYGAIHLKNNKYKSYTNIVLGATLIIVTYLITYKNIQILKEKSENATGWSLKKFQV